MSRALPTILVAVILSVMPMRAYAHSSEVFDASEVTPSYLDIVHAKVTEHVGSGMLVFLMELAAAVPNPPIDNFVAYNWQLDVDPTSPGLDFVLVVRWTAGHWETYLTDERPANSGRGDIIVIDLPDDSVKFSGATQHVTLDPSLIGNPTMIRWRALTRSAPSPAPLLDRAPDAGAYVAFERK